MQLGGFLEIQGGAVGRFGSLKGVQLDISVELQGRLQFEVSREGCS